MTRVREIKMLRWFGRVSLLGLVALSVAACSSGTEPDGTSRGLRYAASTRLVDSSAWGRTPTILASLVVTNVADTTQRLGYADCIAGGPVRLRAYTTVAGRRVTWDSYGAFTEYWCPLAHYGRVLPPGGQTQFDLPVPVGRFLGDSLPPGSFSFTVDAAALQPAYPRELNAGQLTLSR